MAEAREKATVTLEIPIGPQHPALHEPILLRVFADGEEVIDVEVVTGYNHRGIEKLCESNSYYRDLFLVSRTCGICNTIHADVYTRALEQILGREPSQRARYLRVLALELERIHSHLLLAATIAEIVGFDTLFMLIMRDRELVMKAKEILTGCRVHADYYMPGGVRRDIDEVKRSRLLEILNKLEPRVHKYITLFEEDPTINSRLLEVGVIKPVDAVKHGLLGPIVRGSGIDYDIRKLEPYDAYDEIPFNVIVEKGCDSFSRMMVRWRETVESIEMCRYVLTHLPQGEAVVDEKRLPRAFPKGAAFTRGEAPRGELTYYVESAGGPNPYRVKIRTPSLNNLINSRFVYVGLSVADVPVTFASFDPCISCMERIVVIDRRRQVKKIVSFRDLALRRVRV
ncbi:MAG: NADH-quinone oxidoreductase subunit D [Crenarchaeota archaeon]|nr:NADH-quinone oxidoreductase subunit D [Thermoproteota archaeon]